MGTIKDKVISLCNKYNIPNYKVIQRRNGVWLYAKDEYLSIKQRFVSVDEYSFCSDVVMDFKLYSKSYSKVA